MTSLVLTHYRPDRPASGAPLRNWQNIQALSRLGDVDVLTVGVDDEPRPVAGVREWAPFPLSSRSTWDRVKTACAPLRPGIHPGTDRYHSARAVSWLRRRSARRRYDVAVIETIAMAAFAADLRRAADVSVFDAHNIEGVLQPMLDESAAGPLGARGRLKHRVLGRRMAAVERSVIRRADLVWVCSDMDARAVADRYGRRSRVSVVPNGVDVNAYRGASALPADTDWSALPVTMIYPGLFTYLPNERAALRLVREVLPAVRARGRAGRVILVGRDPTRELREAAARDADVEVTGAVESVVPYLEQPCVVTIPLAMGSGTRLKIAEAFAAGRPVVSTAKGVEGIDAIDGEHLLVRDSSCAIADAVIGLWRSPCERARLCAAALDLVRARYSWEAAAACIAASLEVATETGSPRRSP